MKKFVIFVLSITFLIGGCSHKSDVEELSTPENPVVITLWHYYNGSQKNAFDALVQEFNETVGSEKGIYLESHNQGNVAQLEESVMASIEKQAGSREIPNIFASYADTAFAIEKQGYLVDLSAYMTEAEIREYMNSFIQEGKIGKNNELKILPVAKSSEIFLMNKTDWDAFSEATGTKLEELKTKEGLVLVAQKYYKWTDAQTPDIANDGKAFYGRDAMANLFLIGSMQLGHELFRVENQQVKMDLDPQVARKIWDFYYIPYVKGYFSSYGKFRSDDIKIGEIIAQTGSSTSVAYFPTVVEIGENSHSIEALVLEEPCFEGGEPYAVQQGAGMVVTTSTKEKEAASVEFLKWFTDSQRNLSFCVDSGYLPVKKNVMDQETLSQMLTSQEPPVAPHVRAAMEVGFDILENKKMYTNKAFDKGTSARKVLEYHLSDKAVLDRQVIEEKLKAGTPLEEALAPYLTEENFDDWYVSFKKDLEASIGS